MGRDDLPLGNTPFQCQLKTTLLSLIIMRAPSALPMVLIPHAIPTGASSSQCQSTRITTISLPLFWVYQKQHFFPPDRFITLLSDPWEVIIQPISDCLKDFE
jgi:hypothetical protein